MWYCNVSRGPSKQRTKMPNSCFLSIKATVQVANRYCALTQFPHSVSAQMSSYPALFSFAVLTTTWKYLFVYCLSPPTPSRTDAPWAWCTCLPNSFIHLYIHLRIQWTKVNWAATTWTTLLRVRNIKMNETRQKSLFLRNAAFKKLSVLVMYFSITIYSRTQWFDIRICYYYIWWF